ncbi:MAG: TRAP transporter large permease subunit [Spirochaetaceae bacterium]|jgi:tripartite ATP-independent transporter DctM subunit|nr:TRAP transporter large permease subunit [Spirochaetaceae bacterium]
MTLIKKIENSACYIVLGLLTLLPIVSCILRLAANAQLPSGPQLISHLLLVLGLLSGMITTREKEHLSIGLFNYIKNEKTRNLLAGGTSLVSVFISIILACCSASFIRVALYPPHWILFIPDRVFAAVMVLGYAVIAWRFAKQAFNAFANAITNAVSPPPLRGRPGGGSTGLDMLDHHPSPNPSRKGRGVYYLLPILAIILGFLCSLPAIFKLIYGLALPSVGYAITDWFCAQAAFFRVPLILLLVVAALGGTPLFIIIGAFALLLIQGSNGEIDIVANQVYTGLTQSNLVPIPLFTLAGFILSESRAGERLVKTFRAWFGWLPGGQVIVSVIICAFFTSFTGASGVTILALGGILYTVLRGNKGDGYSDSFTIGLLTASGSIGLLFPPSLPILLVGATTRTNTMKLFLGGLGPGLLLIIAMVVFGVVLTLRKKLPVEKFDIHLAMQGLKSTAFELLLPILLILGYFTGILSLVEVSAAAALYVFIVEVLIHKEINIRDMGKVFAKAVPIIGGILSILALAQALSYYIVDSQAPVAFAAWMKEAVNSKWVFLLLLNIALLITGCLVDIFSAIMIILPLLSPLAVVYGIDPVHLGIIFLINMEMGYLTPPVGLNLFLASYRFEKPFTTTARYVLPFLLIQLVVVLIVTYIPGLTLALANLV